MASSLPARTAAGSKHDAKTAGLVTSSDNEINVDENKKNQKSVTLPVTKKSNDVPDKASKQIQDNKVTTKNKGDILPVKPILNFSFSKAYGNNGDANYVIYMSIQEIHGSQFQLGMKKCQQLCPSNIHNDCYQRNGTRHITMYTCTMTHEQADQITWSDSDDDGSSSPAIPISFTGWCPWGNSGVYLKLSNESKAQLQNIIACGNIQNLPPSKNKKSISCDHLSLYRMRGKQGPAKVHAMKTFGSIKQSFESENYDWGIVKGISLRIKRIGTDYQECLVIKDFV